MECIWIGSLLELKDTFQYVSIIASIQRLLQNSVTCEEASV